MYFISEIFSVLLHPHLLDFFKIFLILHFFLNVLDSHLVHFHDIWSNELSQFRSWVVIISVPSTLRIKECLCWIFEGSRPLHTQFLKVTKRIYIVERLVALGNLINNVCVSILITFLSASMLELYK